jgi:hypothetical protein
MTGASLLDPGPAAAAGARHGQLASGLPGGGLAISGHKLVEDGARALVLIAPGLFRLDVRPVQDTLQVMTRSLVPDARWGTDQLPTTGTEQGAAGAEEPARVAFSFYADLAPRPVLARITLASTVDRERGVTHFVAHAVVRETEPGGVRWHEADEAVSSAAVEPAP